MPDAARTEGAREPASAHLELLQRVTEQMAVHHTLEDVLGAITQGLVRQADAALARVWLYTSRSECPVCTASPDGAAERGPALHLCASAGIFDGRDGPHHHLAPGMFLGGRVAETRTAMLVNDLAVERRVCGLAWIAEHGLRGYAGYPLAFDGELVGVLALFRRAPWGDEEFRALRVFAAQAAIAIKNAALIEQVERRRDRLSVENAYLRAEIASERGLGDVVGRSRAMRGVLRALEQVAPTDTTVLLLGETGTGKDLLACALHARSARRSGPLIRVNCAAMAPGLVESELFGHERGAFTGAVQQRPGRFELAHGGTLFLDEVAELSPDIQAKLLRAVQDGEVDRVGGRRPVRVDVRIVAATNRDLDADVASGRFRADLYYRLSVFPLRLPPLRDRLEDLPALVEHFLERFRRKLGKPLRAVAPESLARLRAHGWPGNVRELQNVLERACVLAQGEVVDVLEDLPAGAARAHEALLPLREVEREHVLRVLAATAGVIDGPRGAGRILGLHPNTLRSRMERLGIRTARRAE
ncbi:MAG TPA: sigma 54-interacting transcriptional regulator [Anaeromyxobacteraceae bacterium]|nr:sigma 54-interacting transcriptional regulator [Anaeromyxobacteraceae bacterium]